MLPTTDSPARVLPDAIERTDPVPPFPGTRGPSMTEARDWLAGQDACVLLVDCFDTLVQRSAEPPSAVRTLACARHIATLPRANVNERGIALVPSGFRVARDRVEMETRERRAAAGGDDEAGLAEILQKTLEVLGVDGDVELLVRDEIELEARHTRPRSGAAELLAAARGRGMRVAVLSDMYLPASGVRTILAGHGLIEPDDLVRTSGDEGVNKASGRLYSIALERLGVSARQAVMIGDDPVRDEESPRRLGIKSFLVDGVDDSREQTWRESERLLAGDLGPLCIGERHQSDPVERLGCDALAPILIACARSGALGGATLFGAGVERARSLLADRCMLPEASPVSEAVPLAAGDPATRLVLEAALGPRPGMHRSCGSLHIAIETGLAAIRVEHPLATAPALWNAGWRVLRRLIDAPTHAEARAIGELGPAGGPPLVEARPGVCDLVDRRRRRALLDREVWPTGALASSVRIADVLRRAIGGSRP